MVNYDVLQIKKNLQGAWKSLCHLHLGELINTDYIYRY